MSDLDARRARQVAERDPALADLIGRRSVEEIIRIAADVVAGRAAARVDHVARARRAIALAVARGFTVARYDLRIPVQACEDPRVSDLAGALELLGAITSALEPDGFSVVATNVVVLPGVVGLDIDISARG